MPTLAGKEITGKGFGLMRYTIPGSLVPDDVAFPVFKAALSYGANIWSGADYYGTPEANTLHLLNRYFTSYPADAEKVILTIKGGVISASTTDGSPDGMRRSVDKCNRILDGKKKIDFFGPARVDPNTPIESTVGALAELVEEGKIGGILLSESSAATIKRADKIHHISLVEAELSLWATDVLHNGVAETCKQLDIVVLAHTPLGRGMLAGNFANHVDVANGEFHSMFPRFQGENFEQNLKLVRELQKLARRKGCTDAQFALAWLRTSSGNAGMPIIVPLAGARSEARVKENCEYVILTDSEAMEVDGILRGFPVAGARYPAVAATLLEY
ncbi:Pyridoxal reductase [Lachnellula subtilissima]|uniref:Pyridoxal reductase n=1 Tax=Lachnellula subtilissima TaxID=602034 RepID=A0A8H8U9J6_9HELO|nr:Pyridoxal reductase [Lachnellula subtilissima]